MAVLPRYIVTYPDGTRIADSAGREYWDDVAEAVAFAEEFNTDNGRNSVHNSVVVVPVFVGDWPHNG